MHNDGVLAHLLALVSMSIMYALTGCSLMLVYYKSCICNDVYWFIFLIPNKLVVAWVGN